MFGTGKCPWSKDELLFMPKKFFLMFFAFFKLTCATILKLMMQMIQMISFYSPSIWQGIYSNVTILPSILSAAN